MKKALVICLTLALVLSMSLNALAVPGGFVSSPSGARPPVIVDSKPADDDCTASLIITIFGDRFELPEELRKPLEDAYNDLINSDDLSDLCDELEELAKQLGVDTEKLAISDLFDLGSTGCNDHDNHNQHKVVLDSDSLDHFVGLIYRDDNGEWWKVDDAKVVDGELHFTAPGHYTYAIVVDTTEGNPSKTGDSNIILICGAVMAVTAAALVVVIIKGKKQRT